MPSKQRTIVWLLVLFMTVPGLAVAVKKGRLIGKVLDPEGQPIQGVTVTATTPDVSTFREVETTDKKGVFKLDFSYLDVVYNLRLEKAGFHTLDSDQTWRLEGTARQEFTMYPGETLELGNQPPASESSEAIVAFNAGVAAFKTNDYSGAAGKFIEALELDPKLHQAWAALAVVHLQQGQYREAAAASEQAMALGGGDEMVLRSRWEAYRNLGDETREAEARQALEELVRLTEEAKKIYNEGVALTKAGDHAGAFARFREATELDPNLTVAFLGVATSGLATERFAEAEAAAKTVLESNPRNGEALRIRYNAALRLGDEETLLDALVGLVIVEREIALDGLWRLAIAAYDSGDAEVAKRRLGRLLEVDPDHALCHYHLGLIYLNEGANDKAQSHLERFVGLAPEDPDAATAAEILKYLTES